MKLVEIMPRVCKAVIKTTGGYLKNLKYKICLTISWLLHDSMCYFIVLMSLLFYNVENSKNKEKSLVYLAIKSVVNITPYMPIN